MIWVVLGFALLVVGVVALLVANALWRAGRITRRRWRAWYYPCYAAVLGSMIFLSNDDALGRSRWWVPLVALGALAVVPGLPLYVWSKRQRKRAAESAQPNRHWFWLDRT